MSRLAIALGASAVLLSPLGLPASAATLSYVSEIGEPTLTDVFRVVQLSPDGRHVYASSWGGREDGAVAVFSRDLVTGALTFVEVEIEDIAGVIGLSLVETMVFSHDGESLYAGGRNTMVVFDRDTATGALTFVESFGVTTDDIFTIAVSPDDAFVYLGGTSSGDSGLMIYGRDPVTGALTLVEELLAYNTKRLAVSSDGHYLYAADERFPTFEIRVFARDLATGELSLKQKVSAPRRNGLPFSDVHSPQALVLSADESLLYAAALRASLGVWRRDAATGKLTFIQHFGLLDCATVTGLPPSIDSIHVDPSGSRLFSFDEDDLVVVVGLDSVTGAFDELEQLTSLSGLDPISALPHSFALSPLGDHAYLGTRDRTIAHYAIGSSPSPLGRDCLYEGKSMSIKSAAFGLKKSAKALTDKNLLTFIGVPGSDDDPTCNSDPPGTVRATARFVSPTTGEDTGEIDLPCDNWSPIGSDDSPTRGFKYRDSQRLDGPCKQIKVQGQRALSVVCDSNGPHPLSFDLTEGVDQGIVEGTLTIGDTRYCFAFDDHNGKDGSDGRKFLGKNSPAPAACP